MTNNNNNTESAKKDIEGIKGDIESLVRRLGSIKGKSGGIISEQLEELNDVISTLKGKGEEVSKDVLNEISASTLRNPVRNLLYAFGAGALLALLIK